MNALAAWSPQTGYWCDQKSAKLFGAVGKGLFGPPSLPHFILLGHIPWGAAKGEQEEDEKESFGELAGVWSTASTRKGGWS